MRVEVLLAQPQHFLQPRLIRADGRIAGGLVELRAERRRERHPALVEEAGRQPVIAEAAVALFGHEPGLLEEPEVARDARLREAEDAGELGDVQAFFRQHAQEPQPGLIAEQPVERRGLSHIYKSTCIDVKMQVAAGGAARNPSPRVPVPKSPVP